ncbi:MAG: hypothetical protein UIC63_11860 [Bacteroidaceae bacterium]|nr:hypothetical protein [Bacteroidaceae bacterium]
MQRKKEEGKSVHLDCASPAFSISYGQAKEMATHKGSHLPMYQALASISGDDKIFRANPENKNPQYLLGRGAADCVYAIKCGRT